MPLTLLPSPHDRVAPITALLRWWLGALSNAWPREDRNAAGKRQLIQLSDEDVFTCAAHLPPGPAGAHLQALKLRLPELCPLPPDELEIAARCAEQDASGARYELAMARHTRLAALEDSARARGARTVAFGLNGSALRLATERTRARQGRAALGDAALALALILALMAATQTLTGRVSSDIDALMAANADLRETVNARQAAQRDRAVVSALIDQGVLERRPSVVLADMAAMTEATGDTAWWRRFRWTQDSVQITGASRETVTVTQELSDRLPGWSVTLSSSSRTLDATPLQIFELELRRREGSDER